jgi:hypothetical protein
MAAAKDEGVARRRLVLNAPLTRPDEPYEVEVPSCLVEETRIVGNNEFAAFRCTLRVGEDFIYRFEHRFSALHSLAVDLSEFMREQPPLVELPFVPLPGIPGPLRRNPPPFPSKTIPIFQNKLSEKLLEARSKELTVWLQLSVQLHEFLENEDFVKRLVTSSVQRGGETDEREAAAQRAHACGLLLLAGADIRKFRLREGKEHNAKCTQLAREKGMIPDDFGNVSDD